ncbi:response regulator [Pontibacillus yanchengensis]|uniref:Response regulator n=2 Tax=Pontibacillus yanchengensis TaxID=462910 RepID=A0ACC7VDC1_9BACI|nr:response regulator [Pontibacillus yanchengensis]MYL32316.1 response regulator [Pontibacillus yanchengensis]MYL52896.1 response regulator [Pontibacillus yanchengensis]
MHSVMLVDDSKFMRSWLKSLLHDSNYYVVAEASDGCTATTLYKEHRPEVVILDITLPWLGGIDCLRNILDDDPNANVMMCSSVGHKFHVTESLRIGAKDFIMKPNFSHLIESLDKITSEKNFIVK